MIYKIETLILNFKCKNIRKKQNYVKLKYKINKIKNPALFFPRAPIENKIKSLFYIKIKELNLYHIINKTYK